MYWRTFPVRQAITCYIYFIKISQSSIFHKRTSVWHGLSHDFVQDIRRTNMQMKT